MGTLSRASFEDLKALDSPTVANAIERFKVRPHTTGYAGMSLRCVFPEHGTMLGYAVTCTADSTTEEREDPGGLDRLWEAIENSPEPAVLVIQDVGRNLEKSCHLGEVMATTAKALGSVGCICDGGLRDIEEIRELGGFQLFCRGFVVSHGNPVICEVDTEVEIGGLQVRPGDLLHADVNGILSIPEEIAEEVAAEAYRVREMEAEILEYVNSPEFSLEGLRELRSRFRH